MASPKLATLALLALAAVFLPRESAGEPALVGLGLHYGSPLGLTGRAGILPSTTRPFVVEAEAGTGGGKLGAGIVAAFVSGDSQGSHGLGWGLVHTLTLRGVAVRTWGEPLGLASDRTLVGGEVEYSLFFLVNVQGGLLYPVDGKPDRDYVFTWGVGVNLFPLLKW